MNNRPEDQMAIVRGHYVVRNKMAAKINEQHKRILELEAEVKRLMEELNNGSVISSR